MSDASSMAGAVVEAIERKVAAASEGGERTVLGTYRGEDAQGKPWVLIAGADEPTPVRRMSVQAEVGDTVTVTVGNGMAVVDSNVSNPSASASNVERVDGKATVAQETAVEAIDYAVQASTAASNAQASADAAGYAARNAQASADSAQADAARANDAATRAVADAATARTAAESAQEDAETAMTAAQKATYGLSDVEKVVGTLNWIAEHGEYVLTTDTVVDASKVYYTRSGTSPDYVYTVVADPKTSELSTYYELDLDESVQQYIAAHLWLDDYGLNLSVDSANGYRIHQGTVDGTKAAGMYVLDALGEIVAQFGAGVAVIGKADSTHVVIDADSMDIVDGSSNVLATFGESSRIGDSTVGNSLTMTARGLILNSGQGLDWRIFDITDLRDPVTGRYDYFEQSHLEVSTTGITLTTKPDDVLSIEMETYPDDYGGDIDFSVSRNSSTGEVYVENIMYLSTETGQYKYFGIDTDIYVNCRMTDPYKTTYLRFGTNAWPDMYIPEATVMPAGMSVAMGVEAYATGESSFAFGNEVEANGNVSFAEGCSTANGSYSHSEGEATAIGNYSHAEGQWTRSEGVRSHAEGGPPSKQFDKTVASGLASHAEGYSTASGDYSHAQGYGTIASKYYQTALGAYNIEDTTSSMYSGYLVIVGNGRSSGSRSNALTVDWSGNVEMAGDIEAGNTLTLGTNTSSEENGIKLKGGGTRNSWVLRTVSAANGDGDAVIIGDGGLTIIGGGESAGNLYTALGIAAGSEQLHLSSDNSVYIVPNCQTIANRVSYEFNANGIVTPRFASTSYVDGVNGDSAITVHKTVGSNAWYPAITTDTKSGGAWSIGNYNNEYLDFAYVTQANRSSSTNTASVVHLRNTAGTIALTSDIGTIGAKDSLAASDISSGTLPVARGGTGKTSGSWYGATNITPSTAPGACASFTLTSSVANFTALTIMFKGNDGFYDSVYVINNKAAVNVALAVIESTVNGAVNIKRATYTFSGTSATIKTYGEGDLGSSGTSLSSSKHITVTRVWGWA